MRVCMVAYTGYKTDNRVMRYAETLASRGDHVDVFALGKTVGPRYELVRGVHVHQIQRRIFKERHPVTYLIKIVAFTFNAAFHIGKAHLRDPYDLIHVHSIPDFLVFAAMLPKIMGAKCILDIHDSVPEYYADKFGIGDKALVYRGLLLAEKVSARFAHHVIAANDIWGERLVSRAVTQERCTVFLNYPDRAMFRPRENEPDREGFVLSYPGSLSHHQGLDIAVRAMPLILREVPDAQLHIYGGGGTQGLLESLVTDLGLEDSVVFRGLVPLSEVGSIMAEADFGIVPKRADGFGDEAFSTKILEFMSVGVPVVASKTTIDRRYFDDSEIAFFESGDEKALADRVIFLCKHPEERARIARNGLACAERYAWDNHKGRYLSLVDGLVATEGRVKRRA